MNPENILPPKKLKLFQEAFPDNPFKRKRKEEDEVEEKDTFFWERK